MKEESLIEIAPRRPSAGDDVRHLCYSMTPFGRRVLAADVVRLHYGHRVRVSA